MIGALKVEQPKRRGLGVIYVQVTMNGRRVSALVDIGATYDFVFNEGVGSVRAEIEC